jgi:hypothetical protein
MAACSDESLLGRELVATAKDSHEASDAASSSSASALFSALSMLVDVLGGKIDALRKRKQELAASRKRLRKELKNAEKRRRRLKQRAQSLSTEDLVAVMQMRASAAKVDGKKKPPATGTDVEAVASSTSGKEEARVDGGDEEVTPHTDE